MNAVFRQIERLDVGLPHLDRTGDFVSMLQDDEDRLIETLEGAVYNGFGPNVLLAGKRQVIGQVLYDAIDMRDAPDGAEIMAFLRDAARDRNPVAKALVDRLISAYAKANAEVEG